MRASILAQPVLDNGVTPHRDRDRLDDLVRRSRNGRATEIRPLAPGGSFAPDVIHDWKANGNDSPEGDGKLYRGLQEIVPGSIALLRAKHPGATIRIEGVLWVQGESDTPGARPAYYEENLRKLVADMRATFDPELRFVISRLSDNQTGYGEKPRMIVRAAQEKVAREDKRITQAAKQLKRGAWRDAEDLAPAPTSP